MPIMQVSFNLRAGWHARRAGCNHGVTPPGCVMAIRAADAPPAPPPPGRPRG
jgi:hypothetical protein